MKTKRRKLGALLVTIITVLAMMLAIAPIALAGNSGDYEFEVSNGTATITGYTGMGGDIVIPSTISDYPVTVIADSAFSGHSELNKVTIFRLHYQMKM